jgi:hypothetical protein
VGRELDSYVVRVFGGPFPLRERLLKQAPIKDMGEVKLYAAAKNPEIDVPKLTHFGCGVFFKAAVHPWHGDPSKPYIEMEHDEIDALRQYLLGKADLPKTMALCVTVDSAPVSLASHERAIPGRASPRIQALFVLCAGYILSAFIGDGAQEKIGRASMAVPTDLCCTRTCRSPCGIPGAMELKDAERPQKLLDMMADLEKKGLNVRLGD